MRWPSGTGAGGSGSSNNAGSEGSVPGASTGGSTPGTSACSGSVICSTVQGVDATAATPTTTTVLADDGSGLPDTGAPAGSQGLLVVGFGLLAAGGLLVRPRKLARHRG